MPGRSERKPDLTVVALHSEARSKGSARRTIRWIEDCSRFWSTREVTARAKANLEFGDFQTPVELADRVCGFLVQDGLRPAAIIEPTCGTGTFLVSALQSFPTVKVALGVEINAAYLATARSRVAKAFPDRKVDLRLHDFFDFDWPRALGAMSQPILVVGNPPWVTASRAGAMAGSNLPTKSNFMRLAGMDAKTGKSNFDITEWMVTRLWECLKDRDACFALLMKTSVARRVLQYVWSRSSKANTAHLLPIDAATTFGAGADAGLLVMRTLSTGFGQCCAVADPNDWGIVRSSFGMRDGVIVADLDGYDRTLRLRSVRPREQALRWRSGIKHDCAQVLELRKTGTTLRNRLGETVNVEDPWVFPLLKGSAVANAGSRRVDDSSSFVIVTQRAPGEDTWKLASVAPRLWGYLTAHRALFERRRSSIYTDRPPFAVFGVGPYTFQPWKVAVCGLYKRLTFVLVGPRGQRPVVLDDTSYHLSFDSEEEARLVLELLNSDAAREFLSARVFWDAKRPITAGLLQQLNLLRLAEEAGRIGDWDRLAKRATLFETLTS